MSRYVPDESGEHYFEATIQGSAKSWYWCSRCVDVEKEAMRVHRELPLLLPVYVWSIYERRDGRSRYRIPGPWESPTMDQEYGPSATDKERENE